MTLRDFILSGIAFAIGGIAGVYHVMWQMTAFPWERVPWSLRVCCWRFWGFADLAENAVKIERTRRELYGIAVVRALLDRGDVQPMTPVVLEDVLSQAERRFEARGRPGK